MHAHSDFMAVPRTKLSFIQNSLKPPSKTSLDILSSKTWYIVICQSLFELGMQSSSEINFKLPSKFIESTAIKG